MLKVKVNSRELESALKRYARAVNKTAEESIAEMARTGARQLAMRTEPFGLSAKAKTIGEMAVSKDISLAYASNARTYNELKRISPRKAAAYAAAMNAQNFSAAEKIVRSIPNFRSLESSDGGKHLESLRNRRGRVSNPEIKNLTLEGAVSEIRKEKLRTAGTAKSGWVAAALDLGNARFPAWLRKQGTGAAKTIKRGWKTVVSLFNFVGYINNVLDESKLNRALRATERNHLRRIQTILAKLSKKV